MQIGFDTIFSLTSGCRVVILYPGIPTFLHRLSRSHRNLHPYWCMDCCSNCYLSFFHRMVHTGMGQRLSKSLVDPCTEFALLLPSDPVCSPLSHLYHHCSRIPLQVRTAMHLRASSRFSKYRIHNPISLPWYRSYSCFCANRSPFLQASNNGFSSGTKASSWLSWPFISIVVTFVIVAFQP